MAPTSHKRRWSSRIGTIIRRTSKSHRLSHSSSISFDQDVEFVPRKYDDSGKTFPHVALDIQPMLSTLCSIAESPLRETEATQSVPSLCSGGPFYEVDTPSSVSLTPQVVTDSPGPALQIGEISIIPPSPSTSQVFFNNEPRPSQLHFTEGPTLTTEDDHQVEDPRSESTDEVSTASFYEMTHCNSIHHDHGPSKSSLSTTSRYQLPLVPGHIDTCLPLLTPHVTLETPVTTYSFDDCDNVVSWFPYSASSDKLEKLHTIGWLEYHLPNGEFYYFHQERKISTEVDLTNDTFLSLVEEFWEEEGMDIGSFSSLPSKSGMTLNGFIEDEIWLKDIGLSNGRSKTMFEIWWVNHVARTVVLASQETGNGSTAIAQEDQIDMEHRYWAFMQSHPVHTALPPNAKSAAINTLAWAWTDHLLSLRHSDSIPFTRDECRDSMTLLQSLIVEKHHHQVIQTCIVAKVFLQVAQWHKSHRQDKASPTDIPIPASESQNQLPDSPVQLEKPWVIRHIFLDLVIFVSILLFILLYSLDKDNLMFAQVKVFMDKIGGSLGQASASLPTLNWTRTLECLRWPRSGWKDMADAAI